MQGSRLGGFLDNEVQTVARPAVMAGALVMCPMMVAASHGTAAGWMHEVYRLAYEQARAAVAPTWYDRASRPSAN